jgi:glutamate mutase epsilon subunit
MDGWRAVLGPADVHAAVVELDLMPLEIADLRGSKSMTIGDQDHGRVSMSVAAVLAGIVHELFDLAARQVLSNCTVYSGWWAGIPSLIPHRKFPAVEAD